MIPTRLRGPSTRRPLTSSPSAISPLSAPPIVGAPNPGGPASRRVPQTFEVKPTAPDLPAGVMPDELMIEWNEIPAGSSAQIYLPAVSAAEVVATADTLYTSHLLQTADAHTLQFPAAGITYIPIPPGQGVTFAGLLTLELPGGIRAGDTYTAVVRQLTSVVAAEKDAATRQAAASTRARHRQWRRTTGMFKVTIPVSTKTLLLPREEQYFSILEWIASAIPATSRWYPVMQRYLIQIADRVTFMGGDPAQIPATGTGILAPTQRERRSVGKVESVLYDRFGDFEGFTLETMDGDYRRFSSREPAIALLVTRAWEHRYRICVIVDASRPHRPVSIEFLVW